MGLDVSLTAKKRDFKILTDQKTWLSRMFCNFLCGPDAYQNSNFSQIEEILNIDLSMLRRIPDNIDYEIGRYYYEVEIAKEKNDLQKVESLTKEFERLVEEWEKNYDANFEGWTKIEEMENLINTLLGKINQNPEFYKSLVYESKFDYNPPPNSEYYLRRIKSDKKPYFQSTFIDDLHAILLWIKYAKEQDVKYVAFEYG